MQTEGFLSKLRNWTHGWLPKRSWGLQGRLLEVKATFCLVWEIGGGNKEGIPAGEDSNV